MIRKPMKKLLRSKRGVTPVISTVILVAVAITVAVAVAYWMGGIAGQYTRFEKLEISSAYAVYNQNLTQWDITINVKNTGATDATFEGVYVNGKPVDNSTISWSATQYTVISGDDAVITVNIADSLFNPGTTVELKIHTAAGLDYPQMITLP